MLGKSRKASTFADREIWIDPLSIRFTFPVLRPTVCVLCSMSDDDGNEQKEAGPSFRPLELDEYRRYGRQMIQPEWGLPGESIPDHQSFA